MQVKVADYNKEVEAVKRGAEARRIELLNLATKLHSIEKSNNAMQLEVLSMYVLYVPVRNLLDELFMNIVRIYVRM